LGAVAGKYTGVDTVPAVNSVAWAFFGSDLVISVLRTDSPEW
jgi:hypothetical protein